jgi:uncharacterized phosphosugar-binding protein
MPSSIYEQYYQGILSQMKDVMENQLDNIEKGASWIADAVKNDKLVHVYGTGGHNFMAAVEFFARAGSLLNYSIMMPGGTECYRSNPATENLPGLAKITFDSYGIKEGDLVIIVNCNGINATTIESALECRERKARSIGITSKEFSEGVEPDCGNRHPSAQNLYKLVDLYIDCYTPVGDMILNIDKINLKTGSSSTFTNTLIANLLNARAIEILADQGITPDILQSGNTKTGLEDNAPLKRKWFNRVKHI